MAGDVFSVGLGYKLMEYSSFSIRVPAIGRRYSKPEWIDGYRYRKIQCQGSEWMVYDRGKANGNLHLCDRRPTTLVSSHAYRPSESQLSICVDIAIPHRLDLSNMVEAPQASGSTYHAFSKDFASYQEVNAQAGPSRTTIHLDSQLPQDLVLDEDNGLVGSLMKSLEEQ